MRALLFSSGVAVVLLLLAGCEEVMDKPSPAPMTDTAPSFSKTVADQAYLVEEIVSQTLPHATGGDGPLTYSLAPEIPGLMFDATTRTLSGAPTIAGTHAMTYTVVDGDENTEESDAASQRFTVTVLAACPTHSVTQIVGDWTVDSSLLSVSGWVFSFQADGTFQINSGAVTINGESEGNYSYDVTTCTLAWRGTEPAAEPSIEITIIGHLGFVAIRGTNEHFVDWNGPDSFCERGTADSSVCINTYTRRRATLLQRQGRSNSRGRGGRRPVWLSRRPRDPWRAAGRTDTSDSMVAAMRPISSRSGDSTITVG